MKKKNNNDMIEKNKKNKDGIIFPGLS